jgi:hypothetical protein
MKMSAGKFIGIGIILCLIWAFFTQGTYMNPPPPPLQVWGGRRVDPECMKYDRDEYTYYLCTRTLKELKELNAGVGDPVLN